VRIVSDMHYHPKHKHPAQKLQEGWVELISRYEWDWYITHTFLVNVHPERADKLWNLWCSQISRKLYGPRWSRKVNRGIVPGIHWVRASEYQQRGTLHYHALMKGVEALHPFYWMEKWLNLDGIGLHEGKTGISRIYPSKDFLKEGSIIKYISKYVIKGGDIDLSPNLAGYTNYLPLRNQALKR
jgi:hypothetical protein